MSFIRIGRPSGRRRIWHISRIAPQTPIIAYLGISGWVGLAAGGIVPNGALQHAFPEWLVLLWTLAIAGGGTAAAIGEVTTQTRVESGGLGLLCAGAIVYGGVTPFADRPEAVGAILVCLAIVAMCLLRMNTLGKARRAEKIADHIRDATKRGWRR